MLDLNTGSNYTSPNGKGLLIPNVSLSSTTDAVTIGSPATSLLVYNTNAALPDGKGFYYNAGTSLAPNWVRFMSGTPSTDWKLTGNAGTTPSTNFIGTTDAKDLVFKTNGVENIRIANVTGNVGIGTTTPSGRFEAADPNGRLVLTGGATFCVRNTGNVLTVRNTTNTSTNNLSSIVLERGNGAGDDASITTRSDLANGVLKLGFSLGLAPNNIKMIIQKNGNVGIGTTTPTFNLDVKSDINAGWHYNQFGNVILTTRPNGAALNLNNTAVGVSALQANTTGTSNTANGVNALQANTTGFSNTANGVNTLKANTTGSSNTANGLNSLQANTTGFSNTANGVSALQANTTGSSNTANGVSALELNTTGFLNTANGASALKTTTTGSSNTANGASALEFNTTGSSNTANGVSALKANTTGSSNTASGVNALQVNTTGFANTANGVGTLLSNTTGIFNTANGASALQNNTIGGSNTANGAFTLQANTTGSNNTAVGNTAGSSGTNFTNRTAIGYNTQNTASNQVRIGNAIVTSIGGQVGWTTLSDSRLKKDIVENVVGLDFILNLRPVTYHLDMDAIAKLYQTPDSLRISEAEAAKGKILQSGFIAQEVEDTAKKLGYHFSGVDAPKNTKDYYGLRYAEFVVPLVKGMQEQQQIIENQKLEIATILNEMRSTEARLKTLETLLKTAQK